MVETYSETLSDKLWSNVRELYVPAGEDVVRRSGCCGRDVVVDVANTKRSFQEYPLSGCVVSYDIVPIRGKKGLWGKLGFERVTGHLIIGQQYWTWEWPGNKAAVSLHRGFLLSQKEGDVIFDKAESLTREEVTRQFVSQMKLSL